jgi:serine/threonine protein kinase/formylglycine-generating enzyme required for sulfatase activity
LIPEPPEPAGIFPTLAAALHDRYTIERELGRGGMAIVYLAHDRRHDRPVALKTLRPELVPALGPERFLREIQIAARLQHPNILPLHDSGEANGLLYYVMPYVEGESLRARLDREGQLPIEDALAIACQVADALAYAHSRDVVHRDIKPENILLSGEHALVADFGIARAISEAGGERLTETGLAVGTPAYMSPEQAAAEPRLSGRSDIYSLGCVLYEMLSGQPPFVGPSAQAVIARKLTDPVPPLRTVRESVPVQLEQVILKAMSRAPADRFPSAARLTDALEQLRAEIHASTPDSERRPKVRSWPRALRNRTFLIALGAIAAIGGLGTLLWARESRVRWARNVALPEAKRLEAQGRPYAAFQLISQAKTYLPSDPTLQDLLNQWTAPVSIRSTPPGAQVLVRDFMDSPDAAESLGLTPLEGLRLPLGHLVWNISRPGFQTLEVLDLTRSRNLDFSLAPVPEAPPGMVLVSGGPLPERLFELYSVRPVELGDYWIDKYEVTNRRFQEFANAGGYEKREYWAGPFMNDSISMPWDKFRQLFRDRTGRSGPATWEAGTYPEGQEDFPVGGISWYEAAAYCAFMAKQLPTVYHWYNAGKFGFTGGFARFGNFQADGPAKVGHFLRLGGSGTYDMAGNVKEWAWNQADSHRRYILGGGWNEPSYQFRDYDAQRPLDRQQTYGVRCARYQNADTATLMSRIEAPSRNYRRETPVSDEVFSVYKSLFQYDRTPLEARVDSSEPRSARWRTQWVSFAAAYGNERVPAILVLPESTRPPYQLVVYFPGANAFFPAQAAAEALEAEGDWFLYLVRTGRAVLLPVYKGAYERYVPGLFDLPHVWRDVMIQASKDVRRAVDYLETRPDVDANKVAYFGLSMGAAAGPIMTAIESRFKASILIGGGLYHWRRPPESEALNFLPRVKMPTLMINGRYDFFFSHKTSQGLMFDLLGTPPADKKHRLFDSGHIPLERQEVMKEILDWLDRYLGPVR